LQICCGARIGLWEVYIGTESDMESNQQQSRFFRFKHFRLSVYNGTLMIFMVLIAVWFPEKLKFRFRFLKNKKILPILVLYLCKKKL